ncbi:hypothetical protein [Nannocystis pusilla]|uniref:hypothetical protein n=1 Tax=Nannocystis pusilla TaxID=889268 RepID=UPI003B7A4732
MRGTEVDRLAELSGHRQFANGITRAPSPEQSHEVGDLPRRFRPPPAVSDVQED